MRRNALLSLLVVVIILALGVAAAPFLAQRIAYAVTNGQLDATRQHLAEMSKQDTLSPLFRAVSTAVMPAVVEVRTSRKITVNPEDAPDLNDLLRRFRGEEPPAPGRNNAPSPGRSQHELMRGLGSGVIVDAQNGYVLTNYHVVANADTVEVITGDQRHFTTEWIRTDPQTDLAIVKIKADRLIAAPLGDSNQTEVGDWVLAFGAPEALSQTVTAGIISAKGRASGDGGTYQSFFQTDAAINHGNSGGPLVNTKGEVIGINTAIVSRTGVSEGIGLSIPSNMAKAVMDQLVTTGKVTRGYLGVVIQDVSSENLAKSLKLPDTKGALITQVQPDSPAAKAKLQDGDFIVAIDGKPIMTVNELRNMVADLKPGGKVPFTIYRDGKRMDVEVTVEAQPEDMVAKFMPDGENPRTAPAAVSKFGLTLQTATEDNIKQFGYKKLVKGALVTDVEQDSTAYEEGLRTGMVMTEIEGKAISSADDFNKAASAKSAASGLQIKVADATAGQRYVFLMPAKVETGK